MYMFLRTTQIAIILALSLVLLASCSRKSMPMAEARQEILRKYPAEALRKDYDLLRELLEQFHPSLYWYTPKDSMDLIFSSYRAAIRDSMTQQQFGFNIVAPTTTAIRCGHTSFSYSKRYSAATRQLRLPSFPLVMKVYPDSMILLGNLNRKDSVLKRGMAITSIDGYGVNDLTRVMFRFMPTDGYSSSINYIRLSGNFPYYHRNIFGLQKQYKVGYVDSLGNRSMTMVPVYDPAADTGFVRMDSLRAVRQKKRTRNEKREELRSLRFLSGDSSGTALMTLNSFDGGSNLPAFFRKSFREMKKKNAENLIIDIRSNGGGKVNNYTRLASYIMDEPFRVADSAYAIRKGFSGYGKYFSSRTFNGLALGLFTSKQGDGRYHFNYWEKHSFKPKKNNAFKGRVYVLISGPTFSASTLFAHTVKGHARVTLVGEETGGGDHGNNGLMIPNITLPNTGIKVRMPLFRLVQYQHGPKDGRGVIPDVYVGPSGKAVIDGVDIKMKKALELIGSGVNR
jgi:hypothetical protein